jgi:hypothetical protein
MSLVNVNTLFVDGFFAISATIKLAKTLCVNWSLLVNLTTPKVEPTNDYPPRKGPKNVLE